MTHVRVVPFVDLTNPAESSINVALDFFEENKYPSICEQTIRPYKRLVGDIREWVKKKRVVEKRIKDFSELDAAGVMKYIWDKRGKRHKSNR